MNKYEPLGFYLKKQEASLVPLTFAEIERIIGAELPPSAHHHRPWWSNNPSNNVMTKVWLEAGFETEQVDMAARKLVFHRTPVAQTAFGSAGAPRDIKRGENNSPRHSPLFGALKGTFTIEAGHDLARPALEPSEREALLEAILAKYEKYNTGKSE